MELLASSGLDRRFFIGGSDARTIMGHDEGALVGLGREKRGEIVPENLSTNSRSSIRDRNGRFEPPLV